MILLMLPNSQPTQNFVSVNSIPHGIPSQSEIRETATENPSMAESKPNPASDSFSEKDVKAPSLFERAKEEFEAILHHEKIRHNNHQETHGVRDDFDANTSMSDVKAPNLLARAKEEFVAILHHEKIRQNHHKETHGLGDDMDAKTSTSDVKAPNLFERAKEEFEAILHPKETRHNHHKEAHTLRDNIDAYTSMSDVKAPNVFERAKEEIEAIVGAIHAKKESKSSDSPLNGAARDSPSKDSLKAEKSVGHSEVNSKGQGPHHHKETHGMSDDIDENTPNSQVRGPSVFERAKEEIVAIIETIHPKMDSGVSVSTQKKEGGLPVSTKKGLEKICPPHGHNKD